MSPRLSVFTQSRTVTKRIVLCCACVGFSFLAIVGFGLLPRIQAAEKNLPDGQVSAAPTKSQPELVANYGKLPLSFEGNQGQVSGAVQFLSRGLGYTLFLTGDEAVLSLGKAAGIADAGLTSGVTTLVDKPATGNGPGAMESVLRMKLIGARAGAAVAGAEELPGMSNYFIGNDPAKWRRNVPNYAKVRYQNVYPGVDLVYYGTQGGQLEYDFVVAPGADPHSIGLSFQGAGKIRVDKRTGDLVLALAGSELRFRKPLVYQEQHTVDSSQLTVQDEARNSSHRQSTIGNRQFLDGRFVLRGRNQIGFQVAAYDRRAPLIIDPVLVYSTYLGGGKYTFGYRVAVDASGSAYVAGGTNSSDFPTTAGVFSHTMNPGVCVQRQQDVVQATWPCGDAFVTKLDPTGTQMVYSTYLGGSASDGATGISVDSSGYAYVTGSTGSTDFPTTAGAFQTSATDSSARTHAFATKLNPTGSALIYSTYLAGTHDDVSTISALDSSNYLYVAGGTNSKDFPTTPGAYQTTISGTSCHNYEQTWPCFDGFIAKLNQLGTALVYSTYLGGNNHDSVLGLAVDSTGSAYVTGVTASNNFPTANALQSSSGTAPCGSTPAGNPRPCFFHAFVTKLNSTGTTLDYSTYLGGNGHDGGVGIAVDDTGAAYVTGATNSTNFPTTTGAAQTSLGGGTCGKQPSNTFDCPDAFVAKLAPSGTSLAYSSYLGGNSFEFGWSIAVDTAGNAYVVGSTDSLDFPTVDATQPFLKGGSCSIPTTGIFQTSNDISGYSFNCPNAFLTEIDPTGSTRLFSTYLGGASGDFAFSVALDASGGMYVAGSTLSSNFPITAGALQTSMTGYVDAFVSKFISPSAATPTFSVPAGSYTSPQTVTISDTTTGATIYYTTNGTTPTTSSTQYTGSITVNSTETLEAIAAASGYSPSAVATATYTITVSSQSPAATPSFSIPSGTYTSAQTVTISDATTGAAIYYTTNGTTPTTSSTPYTAPITVGTTETIEAIATASGYSTSAVATAAYTITGTPTVTTLTVASGGIQVTQVASGAVVTLTATVTAGGTAVVPGEVNFCDATAAHCTDVHVLGTAQLSSAGRASLKIVPGMGGHSYNAVFLGTNSYAASSSAVAPLTVNGPYPTVNTISQSGTTGDYTLTATVNGPVNTVGPGTLSGSVSFLDTSNGASVLATAALGTPAQGWLNSQTPATGNAPYGVVVGDFNGDGKPDVAVANDSSNTLTILLGNGDGTFAAASPATGAGPRAVAVGDFNGDGTPDLAVANGLDNTVTILLGNGDGTFQAAPAPPAVGTIPVALAIGDFNGDGKADLAVANYGSNNVTILLGNGDGTFTAAPSATPGSQPWSMAAGDFNGDGETDLVVANAGDSTLTILLSNGDGTFTAAAASPTFSSSPACVVVADFNGDGKADVAVALHHLNEVVFLLGNGDGTFTAPSATLPTGNDPESLAVGDFNGDGKADLAVANTFGNTVTVLLGNGDGTFAVAATPATGSGPESIAAGDFNGDGISDVVTGNITGASASVLLAQELTATATATGVSVVGTGTHLVDASYAGNSSYNPSISATVSLNGTAGPAVSFNPTGLPFGSQPVGVTSPAELLTLTNTGTNSLTISSIAITGTNASAFAVASAGTTCSTSSPVAAGGSCTISVTFSPTTTGSLTGTLTVTDDSNGVAGSTQTVTLAGTGTAPLVTLSAPGLGFGNQALGTTSPALAETVTNTGTGNLTISTVAIGGANASDFTQSVDTCTGATVTPNGTCTVSVAFCPWTKGTRSGTLTFTDNNSDMPGSTQAVTLGGTGMVPVVHWPGPIILPPGPPALPVPGRTPMPPTVPPTGTSGGTGTEPIVRSPGAIVLPPSPPSLPVPGEPAPPPTVPPTGNLSETGKKIVVRLPDLTVLPLWPPAHQLLLKPLLLL